MEFRDGKSRDDVIDDAVRSVADDMWRKSLLPYRGPRDVLLAAEINPNVFTGIALRVRGDWEFVLRRFCKHEFGQVTHVCDGAGYAYETSRCPHCHSLLSRKVG